MYRVAARFFSSDDQLGESYVLISDNADTETRIEVGEKVSIVIAEDGRATHCDCRGRFVPLSVGIRCEWCGKEPPAA